MTSWSLREELLAISHRWPLPLLAFVIGALLGTGAAFILPSPYRAETSLSVAFNGDIIMRNADDFKNWQMSELDMLILSKDVLEETLSRLRQQDPYWNNLSVQGLETQLHVYWRNAGKWRMVAEAIDAERAAALDTAWEQVTLERIAQAHEYARQARPLDADFRALNAAHTDAELRVIELNLARDALQQWRGSNSQPEGLPSPDRLERWRILSWVSKVAGLDPAGQALIESAPEADAPRQAYLPWVDQALITLEQELWTTGQQADRLQDRLDAVYKDLSAALAGSRGLSIYLQIEPLPGDEQPPAPVVAWTDLALVGGVLGWLVWAFFWLGLPALRQRR